MPPSWHVPCWWASQGKMSHVFFLFFFLCKHAQSFEWHWSTVKVGLLCYSVFRNVPQAAMSMKQGNWDRKKVSSDFFFSLPLWLFAVGTQSDYCCMVGSIVQPVIPNRTWHLDLCGIGVRRRGSLFCFLIFTVHGSRAVRQGARDSWTWKNRKGSRLKNAIIWHEGKKPD